MRSHISRTVDYFIADRQKQNSEVAFGENNKKDLCCSPSAQGDYIPFSYFFFPPLFVPFKLKALQLVIWSGEVAPSVPRMNGGDASDISAQLL